MTKEVAELIDKGALNKWIRNDGVFVKVVYQDGKYKIKCKPTKQK